MKKFFIKSQSGQSLMEIIIVMAMSMVILPALLTGLVSSRQGKAQQAQRTQAVYLLNETIDAVRSVREKGWESFAINGIFHPVILGTGWTLATGSAAVNGFTQQVVISDINRDSNGAIASSGGTLDPSSKKVDIAVFWNQPYLSTVSASLYMTRYLSNNAFTQTTVADFNTGVLGNTQVTNTAGGEVTLANNNKAKWCAPALSSATIDLPDGPPVAVAATASATSVNIPNDVFVATSPNTSNSIKLAYVNVTANTDIPVPTLRGTFTLDPSKYSNSNLVPSGINLTNNFKTNDVKYYRSPAGKLYALLATDLSDYEVVAVQINNGTGDSFQDPVNKIYKYWTFFNTAMYPISQPTVVNGNFETGNISPYTTIINSGSGVINSSIVHAGSYSVGISTTKTSVSGVAGGGNCSGGKRIAVNSNMTHDWSGWINVPSSNTKFKDARVRVIFYSACSGGSVISTNDSNLITTTGQGWVKVTGTASAGSAAYAEIQLLTESSKSGATSTVYFDDITFSASSEFNDQAPFGYGASYLTILGGTGYIDSGGYLYAFDLSNIDSKSPTNGLDQIGCRILLDGYDCKPGTTASDLKYSAGEIGTSWSDVGSPAHNTCADGGNIELNADHQLSAVQVGNNKYVYVAVGAGTNPELDIVDISTPPTSNITSNSCGRGGDTGWKVTGTLDFDPYSNTEEAANSVYAKSDGTRAYMSSNGGILHNGISDSDQFYIIDTSNKSSPKFLSTWSTTQLNPPTPTPPHYTNTAQSGYYNGDSTNIQLYPRRALTVLNGERAILVGQDGIPNDGIEPKEYQVLNLATEATPVYCGGIYFLPGFNDLTSVSEADGDNFVYMVANTMEKQLKIIEGGPDTGLFVSGGTFESSVFDANLSSSFYRFNATVSQPSQTAIKAQVGVASPVGGSCASAVFNYVGPNGDPAAYFTTNVSSISGTIPFSTSGAYQNPNRCFKYKFFLDTLDYNQTPVLNDINVNYSP